LETAFPPRTNGPGGTSFYGNRYSNGRVWVEVLAQQQGMGLIPSPMSTTYSTNNLSYFGNTSTDHGDKCQQLSPTNATNALFVSMGQRR
jgi:hypothetical protein